MYQRLLLKYGGGLTDASQQFEQGDCAMICIGLGGTGIDCLRVLKKKVYNRVRPDDPGAAVPSYRRIKFLAVDSDTYGIHHGFLQGLLPNDIDPDTEFFDISYQGDIDEFFRFHGPRFDNRPEYREWLRHKDIGFLFASAGVGAIRQIGRYLFMERAAVFRQRIDQMLTRAAAEGAREICVNVFTGLGGGTGSGIFLDVCYLLREALKESPVPGTVCGYVFLPDVNISRCPDELTSAYIKANGYAAMQELDYCMSFPENGGKWRQVYPVVGLVESSMPPVDPCFLIGAQTVDGYAVKDGYRAALESAAEQVAALMAASPRVSVTGLYSLFEPWRQYVSRGDGACRRYSLVGAASATLPFKEVLTYLASKVFEELAQMRSAVPSRANLGEFIARNQLGYDEVFAQLTQGCDMTFPLPDVKWQDAKGNDDLTVTYFTDLRARVEQNLDRNYSAMSRDLDDDFKPCPVNAGFECSVIARIYNALRAVSVDSDKGPFYAAALLRSPNGTDLVSVIESYLAEVRLRFRQERVQDEKLQTVWRQAQLDFFGNSNFINGRRKYETYRSATRDLVLHDTRLAIYDRMEGLLGRLRGQLIDLGHDFMDVLMNTVVSLIETFEADGDYLDSGAVGNPSEFPIATIGDLRNTLDLAIKEMNIPAKTTDFLTLMLSEEGIKAWINGNENEIFRVVNAYFTTLFADYSHKTMTAYLQDKYHTNNANQLVQAIRNDLMNELDAKAAPLFWTSTYYNVRSAYKKSIVIFPEDSAEVSAAAAQFSASNPAGNLTVCGSTIRDRISILRFAVGVPLYAYEGLRQFERASVGSPAVGKHIYEGKRWSDDDGEHVGRDWRYLPSPVPLCLMDDNSDPILRKNAEEAAALFELAEQKSVIRPTGQDSFGVFVISESFMDKLRSAAEEASGIPEPARSEATAALREMKNAIEYEPDSISLPYDIFETDKRRFLLDRFASSPKLQEKVRGELEKLGEIEKLLGGLA